MRLISCLRQRSNVAREHMATESATVPQLRMLRLFQADDETRRASLPAGYQMVDNSPRFPESWFTLLHRSKEFPALDRGSFYHDILPALIPETGILVVKDRRPVAGAAACRYHDFLPYAVLMYVLVLPEHRRRGLGHVVVHEVLLATRRMGYPGVILHTDASRLAALRTYLRLGFVPDCSDPSMRERWQATLAAIGEDRVRP